jgi:hypothetical protein
MKTNRITGTVALTGLALALTGCLVVPIAGSGLKVTMNWEKQASKLQAARATREQVTRQLGSPAWDFQDLQVIGYSWSGVDSSVFSLMAAVYDADAVILESTSHRLPGQDLSRPGPSTTRATRSRPRDPQPSHWLGSHPA